MPRLFGFEDTAFRRVHESEAVGLRQAASRRLEQQPYPAITTWMNDQGYRTTLGGRWRPATLANVLDHPAIAGLAEDENGELVETGAPQIIAPREFTAIRAMRPSNNPEASRKEQREYLVQAGAGVCGLCGHAMGSSPSNSGSRGYRCHPSTPQHPGGCGKVRVNADLLEAYLAEHALAELAKPEVAARVEAARDRVLAEAAELRRGADADRTRQEALGKEFARGEISRDAFRAADQELTVRIREAAARARLLEQVELAPVGGVPDLVRWWKHAPLSAQRGLVTLLLERVTVYPAASRGSRTVDSDRVAFTWRTWAASTP